MITHKGTKTLYTKRLILRQFKPDRSHSNLPEKQYFRHLLDCYPRKALAFLRLPHQNLLKNTRFSGHRIFSAEIFD